MMVHAGKDSGVLKPIIYSVKVQANQTNCQLSEPSGNKRVGNLHLVYDIVFKVVAEALAAACEAVVRTCKSLTM